MERVSVIQGSRKNVLLVAPHGVDDVYTDCIVEEATAYLDCHAVINRGFERADEVDSINDKADCNNLNHTIGDPVVYQEFMSPIIKCKENYILNRKIGGDSFFVFYIHGMGKNGPLRPAEIALGYGLGKKKNSLTMPEWRVQMLYDLMAYKFGESKTFLGGGGGKYAARLKTNLNQYFATNPGSGLVETVQIEIGSPLRYSSAIARANGVQLAESIAVLLKAKNYSTTTSFKYI